MARNYDLVTAGSDKPGPDVIKAKIDAHDRKCREREERGRQYGYETHLGLSAWAESMTWRLYSKELELAEAGWLAPFPHLFNRETGEQANAVMRDGEWGPYWMVLDENDRPTGEFLPHRPHAKQVKRTKMFKLGYELRDVMLPAHVELEGSGTGLSGCTSCYVAVLAD